MTGFSRKEAYARFFEDFFFPAFLATFLAFFFIAIKMYVENLFF
jgi:hypothetical protein